MWKIFAFHVPVCINKVLLEHRRSPLCLVYGCIRRTRVETIQAAEPKIVTIWPFKEKSANPHFYTLKVLHLFCFFF